MIVTIITFTPNKFFMLKLTFSICDFFFHVVLFQVVNRPVPDQSDVGLEASVEVLQKVFPKTPQDVIRAVLTRYLIQDDQCILV